MIRMNIRRSFSAKLSIWILLLTLPVFFASVGLLFRRYHPMIHVEAVERANGVLDASLQRINRYLITTETVTNTYGWIIERSLHPDSLTALTERVVRFNPYVDGCAISTEPGVLPQYPKRFMTYTIRSKSDSIITTVEKDYNYFSKKWYRTAHDQHKAGWVVYYDESDQLDLDMNGMMASYSRPLYDSDSTIIGVLSTELSLLHLSQILGEEKPYPHSYYIMLDEMGRYIGHPDSTRLFNTTIFNAIDPHTQTDLIALGYEMTKGGQGAMSVVINGDPSLVCFRPVPGTKWSLAIVCSESDILKGYNRFTYIALSLLAVALFLIILYCHKMVTRSLRPLRDLLNKTQQITKGNLDVKIERSTRVDDIGCLQNSYVTMLEWFKHNIDSMRDAGIEAQNYNKELEHATQMVLESDKQKTAFMQNMTHQVRTPLNIIMGYAQILNIPTSGNGAVEGVSEEEIKGLASAMSHNSKLLNRLVLMLFDSSDMGITETSLCQKHEEVPVNTAMWEMVDYVMRLYPGLHIGFETEAPDDLIIMTNKKYLQYSLAEVLLNAQKYSDRQHILARVELTDTTVRFVIQDTGKGIPEAYHERIFKFFTKMDVFSEGLGLGIPLTRRHAQNLGGSFTLDPTYHAGCRFIFELPR